MNEVKVVAFHERHLELLEMRETEKILGCFALGDAFERITRLAKESVQAATFLYDGRVIFCAGFFQLWPGVIEVWMIPSVHLKNCPVYFAKTIKRYVVNIAQDFKVHRMQTTSYDDAFHERWMGFLGFTKEATMKNFTFDKNSMCLYARYF